MLKKNKTPINTLIFSDSQNDCEEIANQLKNQGLPIRHNFVSNSEMLKGALDQKQWQQVLFLEELPNLPIEQALQLLKSQDIHIPSILLSSSYNEELRSSILAKGVSDCIAEGEIALLGHLIRREQATVGFQQQLVNAQKLVAETSKRNDLLLDSSKDAIAYIHEGMHIYTNPTYSERFGYDPDDMIVMTIMDLIAPEDTQKLKDLLKQQTSSEEEVSLVMRGKKSDGEQFEASFIASSAVYDDEDCIQLLVREIADQSELIAKLKEVSQIDQVTGALNRPAFMASLNESFDKANQTGIDSLLYYIEIDNFIHYRQEFGLAACDELLKGCYEWLESFNNNGHKLGRISDSSFALLVDNSDAMPSDLARELCAEVKNQSFEVSGQTIHITLSIGAVTGSESELSVSQLMSHATSVAHKVQEQGGDDYKIFNSSIDSLLSDNEKVIYDEYLAAKESGQVTLHYQPMMALKGSSQQQYLALLRYTDNEGKWILNYKIFSILEKLGLDTEFDEQIFKHTVQRLAKEKEAGKDTSLFLTMFPTSLLQDDSIGKLAAQLEQSGVDKSKLVITISSELAHSYLKRIQEVKALLENHGMKLCLNNVDISSKDLIQAVKPQLVAFTNDILEQIKQEGTEKIIPVINSIRDYQGRSIITRLEDASALAQIWPLGIDFAMGNYVSKPMKKLEYGFSDSDF